MTDRARDSLRLRTVVAPHLHIRRPSESLDRARPSAWRTSATAQVRARLSPKPGLDARSAGCPTYLCSVVPVRSGAEPSLGGSRAWSVAIGTSPRVVRHAGDLTTPSVAADRPAASGLTTAAGRRRGLTSERTLAFGAEHNSALLRSPAPSPACLSMRPSGPVARRPNAPARPAGPACAPRGSRPAWRRTRTSRQTPDRGRWRWSGPRLPPAGTTALSVQWPWTGWPDRIPRSRQATPPARAIPRAIARATRQASSAARTGAPVRL